MSLGMNNEKSSSQFAVRSSQFAVRKALYRKPVWIICTLLLGIIGFGESLAAISSCGPGGINHGSFGTSIHDVFIAPEDFDTLPVGEPVSVTRFFSISFVCSVTGSSTTLGIGSLPVSQAYAVPGQTDMFTTPQLAALGIGYTGWWRMYTDPSWGNGFHPVRQELTSVEAIEPPV